MDHITNISIFKCIHKHWIDDIYIDWYNNKFNRIESPTQNGEISLEGNNLKLKWYKWPVENLIYNRDKDMFTNEYFKIIPKGRVNNSNFKIPKIIHQIWIGPKKRPEILMKTFKKQYNPIILDNPNINLTEDRWYYILWDEEKIEKYLTIVNRHQYNKNITYNGKSDILRYEILYQYGGIYFDADCICFKKIPEHFLSYKLFSVYENEKKRPGLIANGILGSVKECDIMIKCIKKISGLKKLEPACNYLGPYLLTDMIGKSNNILINPSYVFLPTWLNPDSKYSAYPNVLNNPEFKNQILGNHFWGSTNSNYNECQYTKYFNENYPGISILIPVYNENVDYFKECIDSILKQDFKYIMEVIIVNDGSNKIELINYLNYLNQQNTDFIKFKVITLQNNSGIAKALNTGILECSFDLIARMDSDDIMTNDRISTQYTYFMNQNVDVLGTGITMFYENGKSSKNILHPYNITVDWLKKSKTLWFLNHPTVMFKKSVVLESGNYIDSNVAEDFDLWIRILKKKYIIHNLSKICLKYRRTNNNLTRKNLDKHAINRMIEKINNL
jgi:hypothetical protein